MSERTREDTRTRDLRALLRECRRLARIGHSAAKRAHDSYKITRALGNEDLPEMYLCEHKAELAKAERWDKWGSALQSLL